MGCCFQNSGGNPKAQERNLQDPQEQLRELEHSCKARLDAVQHLLEGGFLWVGCLLAQDLFLNAENMWTVTAESLTASEEAAPIVAVSSCTKDGHLHNMTLLLVGTALAMEGCSQC